MYLNAMFTDLEKVQINFPDICFEKRTTGGGGFTASLPGVFTTKYIGTGGSATIRANQCLSKTGFRMRAAWSLEPLAVVGATKDICATEILETIEFDGALRQIINDNSGLRPESGVEYFPVFESDSFHSHGDPDFMDFAKIMYEPQRAGLSYLEDAITNIMELFHVKAELIVPSGAEVQPQPDRTTNEVVKFEINYGRGHSHSITAETLAVKLEPHI